MTTLQFNYVGASCGLLSTVGAGLTYQGHAVCGVTLSVLAATTSIIACVSWFRGRLARVPATIEPLR
jgi:hypothetical protein